MENWKGVIVNACVTGLLIFGGIALLFPRMRADNRSIEDALNRQTAVIEGKFERIEKALEGTGAGGAKRLEDIAAKLDTILARLSSMEESARRSPFAGVKPPLREGLPPMSGREPGQLGPGNAPRWIDTLPEKKREAVREIFRENARATRERFMAEKQEGSFDVERFREMREEQETALKEALKEVLTQEEYDGYLKERSERVPGKKGFPGSFPQGPNAGR